MSNSKKNGEIDPDAAKICHDFQYKSLVETVNLLAKGVTYYFAIVAATLGYVFSANLNPTQGTAILVGASAISLLFAIIMLSIAYGVIRGLRDLKQGMKRFHPSTFDKMEMEQYFRRGIAVSAVVAISCFLILLILTMGLVLQLFY